MVGICFLVIYVAMTRGWHGVAVSVVSCSVLMLGGPGQSLFCWLSAGIVVVE